MSDVAERRWKGATRVVLCEILVCDRCRNMKQNVVKRHGRKSSYYHRCFGYFFSSRSMTGRSDPNSSE